MTEKVPFPPPADLRDPGLAMWSEVTTDFDLGPDEVSALREACRTVDELADLRTALTGQPMTVAGSTGQQVAHPLLAEVRRHREILAKLLERLNLPAGDEDAGSTPAQRRAQRAAQQRWRDRQVVKKVSGVAVARRRDDAVAPAGPPPAWLLLCDPARWIQVDDVPPPDWAFGTAMYRRICADQRWRSAGREWLAEHGRDPREWFQLTRAGRRAMARRREQVEEHTERQEAPRWIRQTLAALREFHQRGLADGPHRRSGPWKIPEGFTQWRKAQQDAWCAQNGCWRAGTKTCEQVYRKPCDGRRRDAE